MASWRGGGNDDFGNGGGKSFRAGAPAADRSAAWPGSLRLNSLRGLACLLLVGFHVTEAALERLGAGMPGLMAFHEVMEPVRMPLFSFLSGFIYAFRPVAPGAILGFEMKKVRRLLVPFLCLTVLLFAMKTLTDPQGAQSFGHYLLHPFSHLWFLQALFFVFLLYALVDGLFPNSLRLNVALVFAGSLALFLSPFRDIPVLSIGDAAYILPFFSLGVLACRNRAWLENNARTLVAALAVAAVLFLAYAFRLTLGGGEITKHDPIILGMSLTCILLLLMVFPRVGWLASIGVYSFSIYLFHTIFTEVAVRVAPDNLAVSLSAAFVAAIAGPIVVEIVITRYLPVFGFVIGKRLRAGEKGTEKEA
jgi:peptidoglycan/LPS O-acetylase OafA/YrhL